jgi:hypothetical protein
MADGYVSRSGAEYIGNGAGGGVNRAIHGNDGANRQTNGAQCEQSAGGTLPQALQRHSTDWQAAHLCPAAAALITQSFHRL